MAFVARNMASMMSRALTRSSTQLAVATPCVVMPVRNATFSKVGKVASPPKQVKAAEDAGKNARAEKASSTTKKMPTLNDLSRQLWKRIHPDLFTAYPVQKEVNEQSLMVLQGMLTQLKDASGDNTYPKIKNTVLTFYLRTATVGHFQKVELLLHTNGGLCKTVIHKQLQTFFIHTGIGTDFVWDAEYFPMKEKPTERRPEEEDESSHSSHSNYNETYEEFSARTQAGKA